ncbi:MAG: glutamate synthase domain-containing protein 2 [Planctomycetota bacterium]|jgi:glutamate synthase domain-containing protein 2
MVETGITPDFITVDGSEGGTGAAPLEFSNAVGTPLRDALVLVNCTLTGVGLRDRVTIIASGKAISAFHVLSLIALGADAVNSARAMMFALGCIPSLSCNKDTYPTGIATQNPVRYKSLDVNLKAVRVANYHAAMIKNVAKLLGATGLESLDKLRPEHINRRISTTEVKTYADIYPHITEGSLLVSTGIPEAIKADWENSAADR